MSMRLTSGERNGLIALIAIMAVVTAVMYVDQPKTHYIYTMPEITVDDSASSKIDTTHDPATQKSRRSKAKQISKRASKKLKATQQRSRRSEEID